LACNLSRAFALGPGSKSRVATERPISDVDSSPLHHAIGRSGFFTLAFGAIVGSGWVVLLGDWLKAAGPGGATAGFLIGGLVMMLIGLCYGELAARFSRAGAEFLYALETLGSFAGFLVGWLLASYAIAVCAFEAIALCWLLRMLLPAIELPPVYSIAGSPVTGDALIVGLSASVLMCALHYRGAASAIRFQNIVTYGFIAVSVAAMTCGFTLGSSRNLQPLFPHAAGASWVGGAVWIFSTCAFFLTGWQAALHAIEERRVDVSTRDAVLYMVGAIIAAALFYCGIVLAVASAVPWTSLIGRELPAVAAFRALGGGGVLGTVLLVAAIVSLTKTWSAVAWIASRLLFAQARRGLLPEALARVDPASGAPRTAILFVTGLTMIGVLMGRTAILPIVNMASICLALSMILCLVVLLRLRWRRTNRVVPSYVVPGGTPTILIALVGGITMIGVALLHPLLNGAGTIPLEWVLLLAWGTTGIVVWVSTRAYRTEAL
jgi:APA family basic amino acid/polyamine antiporter